MKIGDLEKNSEAIKVAKPSFNKEMFLKRGRPGRGRRVDASSVKALYGRYHWRALILKTPKMSIF